MSAPGRSPAMAQRLVSAYITSLRQHLPTSSIRQLDQLPAASEQQLSSIQRAYPGAPMELMSVLARVNGTCWEALKMPPGVETSDPPAAPSTTEKTTTTLAASTSSTASAPAAASAGHASAATAKPPTLTAAAASYLRATFKGGASAGAKRHVKIAVPIFGSALGACPYYLMSVDQMLSAKPFLPPPWKNGARQPAYSDALSEGEPWSELDRDALSPSASPTAAEDADGERGQRRLCTIAGLYEGFRIIADPAEAHSLASASAGTPATGSAASPAAAATSTATPAVTATQKLQKIISGEVGVTQGSGTAGGSLIPPVPTPAAPAGASTPSSTTTATTDIGLNISSSAATTAQAPPATGAAAVGSAAAAAVGRHHWVYVDPRIDVQADLNHWLGFADSIYPHHQREVEGRQQLKNLLGDTTATTPTPSAPLPLYKTCESRLFVDFSPSPLGTSGQIVQFVRGGQRTTKRRLTLYLREGEETACAAASDHPAGAAVTVGECDSFVVIASDFGEYLKLLIREEYEFTEDLEDEEDEEGDDEPAARKP